jgi:cell division protein FtsB
MPHLPEQADMYPPIAEPAARAPEPLPQRALNWATRAWRPAGSVMAVLLALLLGWHVVNGKHGLSTWNQKRAEDKQLQKEIDDLQQENARLHTRVDRLKSNPDEIEHEARDKGHYAKPGEVIYVLPAEPAK